jgi:carbonic anhydrase
MTQLNDLFARNRSWAAEMERKQPGFFTSLTTQQKPRYMWIGCSDSRVPANQIIGLAPGEIFVHRNVANVVVHSDLNALSTIQFAVERLQVRDILLVGHYGCSGVQAALEGARIGLADNWLRHIQDVRDHHRELIEATPEAARANVLCELNAVEQILNVAQSTVVQDAWLRGQALTVHGWVYGVHDGLLHDLKINMDSLETMDAVYQEAIQSLAQRTSQLKDPV